MYRILHIPTGKLLCRQWDSGHPRGLGFYTYSLIEFPSGKYSICEYYLKSTARWCLYKVLDGNIHANPQDEVSFMALNNKIEFEIIRV